MISLAGKSEPAISVRVCVGVWAWVGVGGGCEGGGGCGCVSWMAACLAIQSFTPCSARTNHHKECLIYY